jgi:hypothetical protein
MHHPDTADRLLAELIAVRIVATRLLFELAWQLGDPSKIIPKQHQAALEDLDSYNIRNASDERVNAMRAHAQRVLDEIFTTWKPLPKKPSADAA